MSAKHNSDTTNILRDLEKRRSIIAKLLSIARSIEPLKCSLEALMLHNQAGDEIPDAIFSLFGSLGQKIKNLSDAEIALRLANLDKITKIKFESIRSLIEEINTDTDTVPVVDISESLMDDFRRQTQTSLALRCLLKRRGVKVEEHTLPITSSELKEKLKKLTLRELETRNNAVSEIETMMHDIDVTLNSDYGQAMQNMLTVIRQGLFENLAHIKSGKSLFELPMLMENIELSEANLVAYDYTEPAKLDGKATATDEITSALPEADAAAVKKSQTQQDQHTKTAKESKGIWQRFIFWLGSPWKVKWKDTKK